jgi:hypothetical protein
MTATSVSALRLLLAMTYLLLERRLDRRRSDSLCRVACTSSTADPLSQTRYGTVGSASQHVPILRAFDRPWTRAAASITAARTTARPAGD